MSYSSTIREEVFNRLGIYVRWWYDLGNMGEALDTYVEEAVADFKIANAGGSDAPSRADKAAYEAISVEIRRQKQDLESLRYAVVNLVSGFIGLNVKDILNAPHSTPEALLNHLVDLVDDGADSVTGNTVGATSIAEDPDNSALYSNSPSDLVGLPTVSVSQLARNDYFSLTCIDDSTVDRERWSLESAAYGVFSGDIVTEQAAQWTEVGLDQLVVQRTKFHDEEGDTLGKISDWKMTGAIRGTNVAADGRVWAVLRDKPSLGTDNDVLGQVSGWAFTTDPVFGTDTDVVGKMHVSVVKEPSGYAVLGGATASLTVSGMLLDGLTVSNTTSGSLYVKVLKQPGTTEGSKYTVNLYKEPARTTLVATGNVDDVTVDGTTVLPQKITLTKQNLGGGNYGPEGYVTLNSFRTTLPGTNQDPIVDSTMIIRVPRYFVRLYCSSNRSAVDLAAEGAIFTPSGNVTLTAQGAFSTAGTVDLNYVQDDEAIQLVVDFYTIDMYRAEPDPSKPEQDLVARAGTRTNLQSANFVNDLPFVAVNNSGLTGVSVDVTTANVGADYTVSACFGYAVGDKFTFRTTADDAGRFQTFFRENYNTAFRTNASPTISDTKARSLTAVSVTESAIRGAYLEMGSHSSHPTFKHSSGDWWLWYDSGQGKFILSGAVGSTAGDYWIGTANPEGEYAHSGGGRAVLVE